MDIFTALNERRSIRKYKNEVIDKQELIKILGGAMYAPSAANKQPWHFLVIDDVLLLDRIREIHPYASMLKSAPLAIVVCGDTRLQYGPGYWAVDCAAATQNLLLAAHGMGIGSCWLGLHPVEDRKKALSALLKLPEHILPFSLISLGKPAEEKPRPERFKPERVRKNGWEQAYFD